MARWPNFYLPAILAVVVARLFYVYVSKLAGRNVIVVFIAAIVLLPVFFFLSVYVVGFVYGLMGKEPIGQTRAFSAGWEAGMRLTGRTGRSH